MLGRNVQAYIDDMPVNSDRSNVHFLDLEELFRTIEKHQLKLNPEKCVFGVRTGKFLDFLLTERGIEANLEKYVAIINMRSLTDMKEVQRLKGRIAAISRFLSTSSEKGYTLLSMPPKEQQVYLNYQV